jgi:monoamine oxidase
MRDLDVVIVGGGAAGVAAARRLRDEKIDCLLVEARSRLGGRAWTVTDPSGFALDLGCGWLHSADHNPWTTVAEHQGRAIDKSPPPWMRPSLTIGFPPEDQRAFSDTMQSFWSRLSETANNKPDFPAGDLLPPGGRWNGLMNAVGTYITGAELDRVSALDLQRYEDTGVNCRVTDGYGTMVAAHGADAPMVLDNPVRRIDHGGKRLRVETQKGDIACAQVIVTVPSTVLAEGGLAFTPELPDKTRAARGLPLGLADKLFLSLDGAVEFETDTRLFGRTDRAGTGGYHLRPFGRPMIEAYFGGSLASELEAGGEAAFFDFAVTELTGLLGKAFARRLKPICHHGWERDPFARGSYSYAVPGAADERAVLAAPVDGRLFFAGEACSAADFSTAHGGFITGIAAAEQVIAARGK